MKQNKPLFIGITGGVGAGKSQILSYIREKYNCEIYLADEVAHEVKKSGTDGFAKLVDLLGQEIVAEDGEIDKKKMAEKIFADAELLEAVNNIIHPEVKKYLLEHLDMARAEQTTDLFFVEAALLIEGGYKALVDEMWYIYADVEVRKNRLKQSRNYSEEKIASIMGNQLSEEVYRENCDFVIDNSGELSDSYRQIDERLEKYKCLK